MKYLQMLSWISNVNQNVVCPGKYGGMPYIVIFRHLGSWLLQRCSCGTYLSWAYAVPVRAAEVSGMVRYRNI